MKGDLKLRGSLPLLVVATALALVACSSNSTASASPTPSAGGLPQSASTAAPKSAVNPNATPTPLDPCVLVTSQEASSLAGASYGAGVAQTYDGGSKGCVYGYQTLNVFSVLVAQTDSPQTAQAGWAQEQAKAQAVLAQVTGAGTVTINQNDVSNLNGADRAAVGSGSFSVSGHTFGVGVFYLIKGATFVTFSDIVFGQGGPSVSVMESEAQTVLGRMP